MGNNGITNYTASGGYYSGAGVFYPDIDHRQERRARVGEQSNPSMTATSTGPRSFMDRINDGFKAFSTEGGKLISLGSACFLAGAIALAILAPPAVIGIAFMFAGLAALGVLGTMATGFFAQQ